MVDLSVTRAILALMAGTTSAAIVRVGFLPVHVPQPTASTPALREQLEQRGWTLTKTLAPKTGREVSTAAGQVFSLREHAPAIELTLTPVRVRGADALNVKTILEAGGSSTEDSTSVKRGQAALLISEQQRRERSAATCVVPGGAATESDQLVKLRLSNDPANTNLDRLRMLAGLQPPREWGCLFAELRTNETPLAQNELLKAWDTVQATLKHHQ